MTDTAIANTLEVVTTAEQATSNVDYLTFVGGRKFILAMVIVLLTTLLCWFGKIDAGVFSVVIIATFTGYTAGNVIQKAKA